MKILSILLLIFIVNNSTSAQKYSFEITNINQYDIPVSAGLTGIPFNPAENWVLTEKQGSAEKVIPYQVENGYPDRIWWILEGSKGKPQKRTYTFSQRQDSQTNSSKLSFNKNDQHLTIFKNGAPVLQYNHALTPPPSGKNPLYTRSGYIHPLYAPSGFELTTIHPDDHIHHMGLWNPWTKTKFEGRELDFWNINKGEATVKFTDFISHYTGPVFAGFRSLHEHIDLTAPTITGSKIALNEEWDVRVYQSEKGYTIVDFISHLNCATESEILLAEYRYGGFGFRANQYWTSDNSHVLTSEGKERKDADASRARWAIVQGDTPTGGKAGIVFMSHPANYQHPEPMRVWPLDANNGRGDVFFNFSPTRHTDWLLEPGQIYTLRYRMFIFDGEINAEEAENLWQAFSAPPVIEIRK